MPAIKVGSVGGPGGQMAAHKLCCFVLFSFLFWQIVNKPYTKYKLIAGGHKSLYASVLGDVGRGEGC